MQRRPSIRDVQWRTMRCRTCAAVDGGTGRACMSMLLLNWTALPRLTCALPRLKGPNRRARLPFRAALSD